MTPERAQVGHGLKAVLWGRIQKTRSGCWLWTGARARNGYGQVRIHRRLHYVHKVLWILLLHEPPPRFMRSRCRVPGCVRPAHWLPYGPKGSGPSPPPR